MCVSVYFNEGDSDADIVVSYPKHMVSGIENALRWGGGSRSGLFGVA